MLRERESPWQASLPDDDLECVQQLLRKRNPALAASLAQLVDDDFDEEMACRQAEGHSTKGNVPIARI
jgi:hypothetical protein